MNPVAVGVGLILFLLALWAIWAMFRLDAQRKAQRQRDNRWVRDVWVSQGYKQFPYEGKDGYIRMCDVTMDL